jgi:hypothetical protein
LFGIHERKAFFVIREHQQIPVVELENPVWVETGETGETGDVFEQSVMLKSTADIEYTARRIIVKLNNKTRNGDDEIRQ